MAMWAGWLREWDWQIMTVLVNQGFPRGSAVKKKIPATNAGDVGWIPGLGRSPGEGNSNSLQYFCLGNPMDRGAWQATVHRGHKRVRHDLPTKQQQRNL